MATESPYSPPTEFEPYDPERHKPKRAAYGSTAQGWREVFEAAERAPRGIVVHLNKLSSVYVYAKRLGYHVKAAKLGDGRYVLQARRESGA